MNELMMMKYNLQMPYIEDTLEDLNSPKKEEIKIVPQPIPKNYQKVGVYWFIKIKKPTLNSIIFITKSSLCQGTILFSLELRLSVFENKSNYACLNLTINLITTVCIWK